MLLKCPECGGQVSDKAAACPHCGAPLKSPDSSNGVFGLVGKWFADRRAKAQEKERLERERRLKMEAEERERQERQSKLEYKRNFNYSSKPYVEQRYAAIDCEKVRKDLCSARSYQDVVTSLAAFDSAQDGYSANLPWLKEWASLDLAERTLDVLYVAFCMDDQQTCDGLISVGYVLNEEAGKKALVKLASATLDEHSKAFIDRYVDLSPDSLSYYQSHIRWLSIVESRFDTVPYYISLGLKPKIGDEGRLSAFRGHLTCGRSSANVAQHGDTTPLSRALDADDINRIRFLLKWGANTDQWLFCCFRCDAAAGPNPSVSYSDPLLYHIQSVAAFKLMSDAGMSWYPCPDADTSSMEYNLVDHLWLGKHIDGSRLELLNYLYEVGYDKPLLKKRDYYQGIVNKQGTSYEKNVDHIRRWLAERS